MAFVDDLEREVTGVDPQRVPFPTINLDAPLGTVPDTCPTYLCPRCGKMEILRQFSPPKSDLLHFQTVNCGVDVFPPMRGGLMELVQNYQASTGG